MTERFAWIDHAKGIAILLVVIGHVWLGIYQAGIYEVTPLFSWVIDWIYAFHMPLFFVLAGMLASRSVAAKSFGAFVVSKCRTVVYPYFIWSTIQTVLQLVFRSEANHAEEWASLWFIVYRPIGQFWFLYTLFFIYVFCALLRWLRCPALGFVAITLVLYLTWPRDDWDWEGVNGVSTFGIFFALGYAARLPGFDTMMSRSRLVGITLAAFFILTVAVSFGWQSFLFCRLSGCLAVIGLANVLTAACPSLWTSYLGRHSLAIFVAHTIFAAAFRVLLIKLGVWQPWLHLVGGVLMGILGPLILVWLEQRSGRRFLFTWPTQRTSR